MSVTVGAPFLISLSGILFFVIMTAISSWSLGSWHESAMRRKS